MGAGSEPRRNRQLQDYTDRFGRESEPRLSRDDELVLAARAAAKLAAEAADLEKQRLDEDAERAAELERGVTHALLALDRVRELLAGDARRSEARYIDHQCRWLRRLTSDPRSAE
jgi:hypothetical protein